MNEEDEYSPDEDAIETIYSGGDYGMVYIAFSVIATIFVLTFLMFA